MKLTIIIMLAACLQVSAKGFSQTITLTGKNLSLENVFKEVKRQSGYLFVYRDEWLKQAKKVDVSISNGTIAQVLDYCFKGQPLTYSIVDKTVVVRLKEEEKKADSTPVIKLTGKITDKSTGKPLEGASVYVKNSQTGTSTNGEGLFLLAVNRTGFVLVVAYTGYKTLEMPFDGRTELNIELEQSTSELDNVVMIAYGQTTKRLNTGSISKINADDIAKQPVPNPLSAMEGLMPGVFITQGTGVPGGSFSIQIRGQNSISSGNNPLYIVDGVPYTSSSLSDQYLSAYITGGGNPLDNIDPSSIESIEVLKDADATSIYGSRGANGVVLITTKKGQAGKTRVDINAYSAIASVGHMLKLLNTQQYLQMRHEAFANDGATPQVSDYDILSWDTTRYTDWQKEAIGKTAHIADVQASVSGGNINTQFILGGGYRRETTVFPGDYAAKKGSVHFNLSHSSPDAKLKILLSAAFTFNNSNLPFEDISSYGYLLPPNAPSIYDTMGKLNWQDGFNNPFSYLVATYNNKTDNLISNAVLSYQFFKGFQLRTSLGYTQTNMHESNLYPLNSFNPSWGYTSGYSDFSDNTFKTWIIEPQAEYQKQIGRSKFNILLGTTFEQDRRTGQTIEGTDFASDALLANLNAASQVRTINAVFSQYRYNAFFGRIKYSLNDNIELNLNGRRDGSSRFGPGKQFANFSSVGTAWIFSSEPFMKHAASWWSFGKLRASYGTTGNDQIGDYQYLDTYSPTRYAYQGGNGLYPTRLFNSSYSWEVNKKLDIGLELGFFKDRVYFVADWYRNRSSNQLVGYSLPLITGFSSIQSNFPAIVQNSGFELDIHSINIKTQTIKWTSSFNISIPRNKLIAYPDLAKSSYAYTYAVGQPLNILYRYQYTGVDKQAGVYQFQDINKDGFVGYPADLVPVKVGIDFYGGLQNAIRYKNWSLDFTFQFVKQRTRDITPFLGIPGMMGNQLVDVLGRWQKPGDETKVQQFTQSYNDAGFAYFKYISSDQIITDGSYVRLRNVSLSFDLPEHMLKKIFVQNFSLYIQAQNLLTITDYKGFDPETGFSSSLPPLRIISGGFKITL
ncbi:MAG: SusC/RagA family TonB-linked outer membrane protein [Bacteroidetes bacterium]|nr:SusC/RagA family TonB-linked outer membrane protein [Bacteroidota bacterium]